MMGAEVYTARGHSDLHIAKPATLALVTALRENSASGAFPGAKWEELVLWGATLLKGPRRTDSGEASTPAQGIGRGELLRPSPNTNKSSLRWRHSRLCLVQQKAAKGGPPGCLGNCTGLDQVELRAGTHEDYLLPCTMPPMTVDLCLTWGGNDFPWKSFSHHLLRGGAVQQTAPDIHTLPASATGCRKHLPGPNWDV